MDNKKIKPGVVHGVPNDLRKALSSSSEVAEAWNDLTPLARNEWICWVISVKKAETREQHIERVRTELLEGKRRPCCWPGCQHRGKQGLFPSHFYLVSNQPFLRIKPELCFEKLISLQYFFKPYLISSLWILINYFIIFRVFRKCLLRIFLNLDSGDYFVTIFLQKPMKVFVF